MRTSSSCPLRQSLSRPHGIVMKKSKPGVDESFQLQPASVKNRAHRNFNRIVKHLSARSQGAGHPMSYPKAGFTTEDASAFGSSLKHPRGVFYPPLADDYVSCPEECYPCLPPP